MTNEEIAAIARETKDRQEIYDCMVRYCRGQDRLDAELSASSYHPDAILDFGSFVGPLGDYVAWGHNLHRNLHRSTMHCLSNHTCEIKGNTAHTETYFIYLDITKEGSRDIRAGRYVDRLEKRDGRWGISARICMLECDEPNLDPKFEEAGTGTDMYVTPGRGDRTDVSYMRPLVVDTKRFRSPPKVDL